MRWVYPSPLNHFGLITVSAFVLQEIFNKNLLERPYSPAISKKEALQEIKECAGSQIDIELAQTFVDF